MKKFTRILSAFLTMLMLLPTQAFAQDIPTAPKFELFVQANMTKTEIEAVIERIGNGEFVKFGQPNDEPGFMGISPQWGAIGIQLMDTEDGTHQFIASRALDEILYNNQREAHDWYRSISKDFWTKLIEFSDWPDDEASGLA